ncbi:MAG: vitamin B12 dependent-methionine synthase activation domain-containing protein, partial [Tenuifilaceae bacterium]|nr:vitamin B12 dependent-methionine synthase activation domain-containing protein [Tenuifilaceae bacterium]
VDIIGLSGLITPSLDEMTHIASEMEQNQMQIPLMVGGATTSKLHTALKINNKYSGGVIHIKDASQASEVAVKLLSPKHKTDFLEQMNNEYNHAIAKHTAKSTTLISLANARNNRLEYGSNQYQPKKPKFLGVQTFSSYSLNELREYIDWTFFFHSWEIKGKYPQILTDAVKGTEATKLFNDANALLDKIIEQKLLTANGVVAIVPAASLGDDILVYEDESRKKVQHILPQLRNQQPKADGEPNLCLADFVAPANSGTPDWIGFFAVSTGFGANELAYGYAAQGDDYNALMVKILADRLAEAFAETLHKKVRQEVWSYAPNEHFGPNELLKEKYQGIRPAPGYPACPDHRQKATIFSILNAQGNAKIQLTESMMMIPAAAVSGYYFAHPQSKYFDVGKIDQEQLDDYSQRMGRETIETEKFIPNNIEH